MRRTIVKAKKFPIMTSVTYISPRQNKWLIHITATHKKLKKAPFLVTYVSVRSSDEGLYAALFTFQKGIKVYFHTPHFFRRYAERLQLDLRGEDVIFHYMQNNTYAVACSYTYKNGVKA